MSYREHYAQVVEVERVKNKFKANNP